MQIETNYLLAVNGTLMRGLALEGNLLRVNAVFLEETTTEKRYRLWSVNDVCPAMLRVSPNDPLAAQIAVEVWRVPASGLAAILQGEPAGLCIGKVQLCDGRTVFGVLGEPEAIEGMREITAYGGWRAYLASTACGE